MLVAFEQVGGAEAAMNMAKEYALERYAFGRQIGSYQAIKHKIADMYVKLELARSNAYYGAMAFAEDAGDLELAAAAARISATEAYRFAAQENIQVHGGMALPGSQYTVSLSPFEIAGSVAGQCQPMERPLVSELEKSNVA